MRKGKLNIIQKASEGFDTVSSGKVQARRCSATPQFAHVRANTENTYIHFCVTLVTSLDYLLRNLNEVEISNNGEARDRFKRPSFCFSAFCRISQHSFNNHSLIHSSASLIMKFQEALAVPWDFWRLLRPFVL